MLNRLAKAALVVTSFSPVLFTYAFVLFLSGEPAGKIGGVSAAAVVLILLCAAIIEAAKRNLEVVSFPIASIKTADGEVLGFLVAYLLPFGSLASDQINEAAMLFIMALFFLIIWSTHSYHINPVLTLFGYHFYEVTTTQNMTFLLITRRNLRNIRSIGQVVQLTDYMVLDPYERRNR